MNYVLIVLAILFFLIIGIGAKAESETLYEKQQREYEREQNRYYRNVKRAIKKTQKGKKQLTESEVKALKRYTREQCEDNKDNPVFTLLQNAIDDGALDNDKNNEFATALYGNDDTSKSKTIIDDYNHILGLQDYALNNNYSTNNTSKKRVSSSTLSKYCESLTDKEYTHNPAVGRQKELEQLMISILTPGKSAIIIGQPRSR